MGCVATLAVLLAPSGAAAQSRDPDPWWGTDKALHFGASATIAVGGYVLGTALFDDVGKPVILGAGMGIGAGAAKEGLDALGLGRPSWRDFTWDILGTAVGVGLSLAIHMAVRDPSPRGSAAR